MKNKNLSEVLESVYKSLHMPPNPMIKEHTERLKFSRKPFLEGYSPRHINLNKKLKDCRYSSLINLGDIKTRKNNNKKKLSIPSNNILRNFDILSPVQKQINEIEETRKSMNSKFKKAINEINSVYRRDESAGNTEQVLSPRFRFPKVNPSSNAITQRKRKNPSLTVPAIILKQLNL